jgi:triosephosphate isomerase
MDAIKKILVPTDFSAHADEAFRVAYALAGPLGAEVVLFHVARPPAVVSEGGRLLVHPGQPEAANLWGRFETIRPPDQRVQVSHEVIVADRPGAGHILDMLDKLGCDLIVLGTHGNSWVKQRLFGSVAEDVVRHARCPVMVIKAPKHAQDPPAAEPAQVTGAQKSAAGGDAVHVPGPPARPRRTARQPALLRHGHGAHRARDRAPGRCTSAATARRLASAVVHGLGTEGRVSVALCPPFPYLALVGDVLRGSPVALGAQNLYPEQEGAFTGEVSPAMLRDVGCQYVLLGHSERRRKPELAESNAFINRKVHAALAAGLHAIVCLGETLEERQAGQTEAVLEAQLAGSLAGLDPARMARVVLAYEPVWAIGTGHSATVEQAQQAHALLRRRIRETFGEETAAALLIQDGGSVKPDNAAALLRQPDVDGSLVGGASLNAEEFLAIVRAALNGRVKRCPPYEALRKAQCKCGSFANGVRPPPSSSYRCRLGLTAVAGPRRQVCGQRLSMPGAASLSVPRCCPGVRLATLRQPVHPQQRGRPGGTILGAHPSRK